MPCLTASCANSFSLQCVIGRPHCSGGVQARARIRQICSGVIRVGALGRGASAKRSGIEVPGRATQRRHHLRTVFFTTPNSLAVAAMFDRSAAVRMMRARSTRRCGLVRFRTIASNSFRSFSVRMGTTGFCADIAVSFNKDSLHRNKCPHSNPIQNNRDVKHCSRICAKVY